LTSYLTVVSSDHMKNIESAVETLINVAAAKYGPRWRQRARAAITNEYWGDAAALKKMRTFFKSRGYDLLAAGAFRIVFGWNDVVFKIDCKNKDRCLGDIEGNKEEARVYKKMLKAVPLAKYFICPLLKSVKVKNSLILVYPKVKVYGETDLNKTLAQEEMHEISGMMFDDMHAYNIGKFCNGCVAIDFNFGSDISNTHTGEIKDFAKRHRNFWMKYVVKFEKELNSLKKDYALA
jgi:hypothetical protein